MNFKKLQKEYPNFYFKGFLLKKDNLTFFYSLENKIEFEEKIKLPKGTISKIKVPKETLYFLIFNLGTLEGLNYWKLALSENFWLPYKTDSWQKNFYKKIILKGLAQHFYQNKTPFIVPKFKEKEVLETKTKPLKPKLKEKILVPFGGGKDSLVTLELLSSKFKTVVFSLNPTLPILKAVRKSRVKEKFFVKRKLDPKLSELSSGDKFLKGHFPFTAYLSFVSLFGALSYQTRYIAFSNEKSSEEENIVYLGKRVNHQWSKTLEFERLFRKFIKNYLFENLEYFSFLRPLNEIDIVRIFSKLKKYHQVFLSCNQQFKIKGSKTQWCNNCPKCLNTFILLSFFLEPQKAAEIFKENLLQKEELKKVFLQLVDKRKPKPLECVGTKNELIFAMESIAKNYPQYFLSQEFLKLKLKKPYLKKDLSKNHFIPEKFFKILWKNLKES